ncbi:MAG: polyphosphate kinase 2 family protein [Candidatus Azobacteroides sp.]|nr:polyphosphate kinase 2 family protein [Candidatus Azobacteroides sp.]
MNADYQNYLQSLRVPASSKKISLTKDFLTDCKDKPFTKKEGKELLKAGVEHLADMQDMLYAHDRYSILIVLQAMDAAGKDGAVRHVISGLNPNGVTVSNFKTPTYVELDHDYLWRHYIALPPRDEIGIFNRSHYENVLVTRVHPEFVLNERLPHITEVKDITPSFWEERYRQINNFERTLAENGTLIIKFFLHVSKEEQRLRFMKRIKNPDKNWKLSASDVEERQYWNEYMKAYEEMLGKTSKTYAPWYVVPADDKWFTRTCIADIIGLEFQKLKLHYPKVSQQKKEVLEQIYQELANEGTGQAKKTK